MTEVATFSLNNDANRQALVAAVREAKNRTTPAYFGLSASRRLWVDENKGTCVVWSVDFDDYASDGKVPLCSAVAYEHQPLEVILSKIMETWNSEWDWIEGCEVFAAAA